MPEPPDKKDAGLEQRGKGQGDLLHRQHGNDAIVERRVRKEVSEGGQAAKLGQRANGHEKKERGPSVFGERCVRLFMILLFTKARLTLTQLAERMNTPKTNILRLVDAIEAAGYRVKHVYYGDDENEVFEEDDELENEEKTGGGEILQGTGTGWRRVYYWLETLHPGEVLTRPTPTEKDIEALRMSTVFAKRLLGIDLSARAEMALALMESLTKRQVSLAEEHYALFTAGTIDYSDKGDVLHELTQAMTKRRICKITYRSPWRSSDTVFHVMPLKIFCYKDALYLQTKKTLEPGDKKLGKGSFNPLLAIHRIKKVDVTDEKLTATKLEHVMKDLDFEKTFNKAFGIIKEKKFTVVAEFTDWAATYVEERQWGPKQKPPKRTGDKVTIEFKASSEPEVLTWILQFGEHGKLLKPDNLLKELSRITAAMKAKYP